jgi:hypothetical protein
MKDLKDIFPGYFIEKPLFQSLKNLRRLLSEQDSCFHTNQVSIFFLEEHIKNNRLDNTEFIRELCVKYSISAGHRSWEVTKQLMAKSYIVQTYNLQEIFFKDFNAEYRVYKKKEDWRFSIKEGNSTKSLDPYSQLLQSIPKDESRIFEIVPESYAIQYYRLLRNGLVHKSDNSLDKPTEYFKKFIEPNFEYFKNYYKFLPEGKLPAPNSPQSLTHNDFFIYSRCLKNLTNLIVNACNLTVSEIFEFELSNEQFLATMNRYRPNVPGERAKLLEALENFFRTKYGNVENETRDFVQAYLDWRK